MKLLSLAVLLASIFLGATGALEVSCTRQSPQETVHSISSGPGLGPLLKSTKQSRRSIFNQELPYDAIRQEISEVYNTSSLNVAPFVIEWLKYSSNVFYLTGFMVFVAVIVPFVLFSFWVFWRCCYLEEGQGCFHSSHSDLDELDGGQSRYILTIAWSLFASILVVMAIIVAFVAILLFGNSYVRWGVREGGVAVSSILPETARVRDDAMESARIVIDDQYQMLLEEVYLKIKSVSDQITRYVQQHHGQVLNAFYANVSNYLNERTRLLELTNELSQFVRDLSGTTPTGVTLPSLSMLIASLSANLQDVKSVCSALISSGDNSSLATECIDLISRGSGAAYDPSVIDNASDLGGHFNSSTTNLQRLGMLLSDRAFNSTAELESVYLDYLDDLSSNFTCQSNSTWSAYIGNGSSVHSNLTSLWQKLLDINSSLSLGLPQSQEKVELYLGSRYLMNWDDFRHVCTVVFVVVVLGLLSWLLVALCRALYMLYEVHSEGDLQAREGLHMAGTAIIKLSFMLTGVCVTSAVAGAVCLIIAGGVGQACHPHDDMSQVIKEVVDNTITWRGGHLLGQAVLGNASYPLTFEEVLHSCQVNQSLYQTLKLHRVINLDMSLAAPDENMKIQFDMDLRALWNNIHDFTPLSPLATKQLVTMEGAEYVAVRWEDFLSLNLSHGIFMDTFVGVVELQQKLSRMSSMAMVATPTSNLSAPLEAAVNAVSTLTSHLNSDLLPSVHRAAGVLSQWSDSNQSTLLLRERSTLETGINVQVNKNASILVSQTIEAISQNTSSYLANATSALTCSVGSCHSLSDLASRFSSGVCVGVVQGLDLYWSSLVAILFFTILVMVLSFVLASRFVDHTQEKSGSKFSLTGAILRQVRALVWFFVGVVVNAWLIATINQDQYFHDHLCSPGSLPGCCPACVWSLGIVFLVASVVVGMLSRVYQCVILHRLSKGIKKVKRYWMDKKKAVQFYGQAGTLLLQDFPFLILSGVYINTLGILTTPAFLALGVAILGSSSYIVYCIMERGNMPGYLDCLRNVFRQTAKFQVHGAADSGTGMGPGSGGGMGGGVRGVNGQALALNGRALNGRYVLNSESEHSESDSLGGSQVADDQMYDHAHHAAGNHVDHRLSVIPEHIEGEHGGNFRGSRVGGFLSGGGGADMEVVTSSPPAPANLLTVPVYVHPQDSDVETTPNEGMRLDRTHSPTESALRQRHEAAQLGRGAGFEVASIRQYESSSASGFGSKVSMTASSSQAHDDMYESSDYRDDDSDYSVHPNRLRLQTLPCAMSVEV